MSRVFRIHDTHKVTGSTYVERISVHTDNPEFALETWWAHTARNTGGPVDTDRYEAREERA